MDPRPLQIAELLGQAPHHAVAIPWEDTRRNQRPLADPEATRACAQPMELSLADEVLLCRAPREDDGITWP